MPPEFTAFAIRHPNVSRETFDKLVAYEMLLKRWQSKINLISPSTLSEIWPRHIEDSLQLLPLLPPNAKIADIGSGAGLPGLILSIAGYSTTLIESDKRKAAFLRQTAAELNIKPSIFNGRAEDFRSNEITHVTSRACAPLSVLFNILCNFSPKNIICLFHKGKNYTKELDEVRDYGFDLKINPSMTEQDSVILEISNIRRHS